MAESAVSKEFDINEFNERIENTVTDEEVANVLKEYGFEPVDAEGELSEDELDDASGGSSDNNKKTYKCPGCNRTFTKLTQYLSHVAATRVHGRWTCAAWR